MRKSKKKAEVESDTPADSDVQPGADAAVTDEQQEKEPDLAQQVLDLESKWLRSRADLDNVRRRARLDVEEARAFSSTALLQSLLPVLDAMQMALTTAPAGDSDPVIEGLRLTEQQFQSVLAAHGVQPVAAELGSPCDPAIHRVLVEQPSDDFAPGQIVGEITKGYTLHGRLLREAQVVVAAKPAPASPEEVVPDADV